MKSLTDHAARCFTSVQSKLSGFSVSRRWWRLVVWWLEAAGWLLKVCSEDISQDWPQCLSLLFFYSRNDCSSICHCPKTRWTRTRRARKADHLIPLGILSTSSNPVSSVYVHTIGGNHGSFLFWICSLPNNWHKFLWTIWLRKIILDIFFWNHGDPALEWWYISSSRDARHNEWFESPSIKLWCARYWNCTSLDGRTRV